MNAKLVDLLVIRDVEENSVVQMKWAVATRQQIVILKGDVSDRSVFKFFFEEGRHAPDPPRSRARRTLETPQAASCRRKE